MKLRIKIYLLGVVLLCVFAITYITMIFTQPKIKSACSDIWIGVSKSYLQEKYRINSDSQTDFILAPCSENEVKYELHFWPVINKLRSFNVVFNCNVSGAIVEEHLTHYGIVVPSNQKQGRYESVDKRSVYIVNYFHNNCIRMILVNP